MLEGSTFSEDREVFMRITKEEYEEISNLLPEFGNSFTLRDYAFAKVTVISRNFYDYFNGVETKFLNPIAGLQN